MWWALCAFCVSIHIVAVIGFVGGLIVGNPAAPNALVTAGGAGIIAYLAYKEATE